MTWCCLAASSRTADGTRPTRYSLSLVSLGMPMSMGACRRRSIDVLGRTNHDAESGEPDIGQLGRGEKPDRRDAEVLEDLGAKADFPPLARPRDFRAGAAGLGMACVGTPAVPSRRNTSTPRPSC